MCGNAVLWAFHKPNNNYSRGKNSAIIIGWGMKKHISECNGRHQHILGYICPVFPVYFKSVYYCIPISQIINLPNGAFIICTAASSIFRPLTISGDTTFISCLFLIAYILILTSFILIFLFLKSQELIFYFIAHLFQLAVLMNKDVTLMTQSLVVNVAWRTQLDLWDTLSFYCGYMYTLAVCLCDWALPNLMLCPWT